MTDRDSFLRTIIDNPDDDTPRLVYADWLEEHGGEPERAEFIRIQCELAKLEHIHCVCDNRDNPRYKVCGICKKKKALPVREAELLSEPRNFVNWSPSVFHTGSGAGIRHSHGPNVEFTGKGFGTAQFCRGFVGKISSTFADFSRHFREIRAATPLKKLTLTSLPGLKWGFRTARREQYLNTRFDTPAERKVVLLQALNIAFPKLEIELPSLSGTVWSGSQSGWSYVVDEVEEPEQIEQIAIYRYGNR